MKPVPITVHLGPIQLHTYGLGLALTFAFGAWYLMKRFRQAGAPYEWIANSVVWIAGAAIIGARVVHVIANRSFYEANPGDALAIWHGGLSSFGGLLFGVPVGLFLERRHAPSVPIARALDLAAPVLAAAWGLGRLLGPQLMIGGGGRPTTAWYGMYYTGEIGRRVPVPLFQALECFAVFGALILIERRFPTRPDGVLIAAAAGLWGLARFFDQFLWLGTPGHIDAVEVAGLTLTVVGSIVALVLVVRGRHGQGKALRGSGT
jgi:phosphatidylglycerol:prolipoprotein diacylglycerol transferase